MQKTEAKPVYQYLKDLSQNESIALLSVISALLTSWIIYIQHGWINDDSVLYFEAARLFSIGEWKLGWELFSWPLYSLLITGLHKLTTLSFQSSAQILTVAFFTLASYSFLRIIMLAGGDKMTTLCGALLLFSSNYIMGDVLPMLIRDQGFWACLLTALVFFIQFFQNRQFKDALYWQIFALCAMLFRIEAITYIALLPLTLMLWPNTPIKNKFVNLIKVNSLNLALLLFFSLTIWFHGDFSIEKTGRLQEIVSSWSAIEANFTHTLDIKAQFIKTHILGEPLKNYAWMSLILSLVTIAIIKSILVAGWLPVLLISSYYKQLNTNIAKDVRLVLLATAFVALLNAIMIIFKVNILSGRYVIFFGFILLIFGAFALNVIFKLYRLNTHTKNAVLLTIILMIICLQLISNILPKSTGYNVEQDAVAYIKQQNIPNDEVFFVTPRARFHAGAPYNGRGYEYWEFTLQAIEDNSILKYRYLMLNLKGDSSSKEKERFIHEKLPQYQLIKTFYGMRKNKKVLIYKRK